MEIIDSFYNICTACVYMQSSCSIVVRRLTISFHSEICVIYCPKIFQSRYEYFRSMKNSTEEKRNRKKIISTTKQKLKRRKKNICHANSTPFQLPISALVVQSFPFQLACAFISLNYLCIY